MKLSIWLFIILNLQNYRRRQTLTTKYLLRTTWLGKINQINNKHLLENILFWKSAQVLTERICKVHLSKVLRNTIRNTIFYEFTRLLLLLKGVFRRFWCPNEIKRVRTTYICRNRKLYVLIIAFLYHVRNFIMGFRGIHHF